jgi:hypothetical protein
MPQGFQNRFKYGKVMRSFGSYNAVPFNVSGRPLIGYESVYTYRSGKRSTQLSEDGNSYDSIVNTGSLSDRMRKRNEYLQQQIRDILTPTTGSTAAFACTGDTGHPFATYKLSATQPYGRAVLNYSSTKLTTDVVFVPTVPFPNFSDPFGVAITDRTVGSGRLTYFPWPAGYPYPTGSPTEIVSNAVKNSVASGVIASANPWKPKANLAQSILELMTGDVPSVLKNLRKHIYDLQSFKKTAGSDWLNVQFGWVPLISDIRDTVEVLLKLHMLLHGSDNYRRARGGDLGSWARITETPYDRTLWYGSPLSPGSLTSPYWKDYQNTGTPPVSPGYIPEGQWSRSLRITADFRFTAKYHRGAQPNSRERGYIERPTELLGLEITPAVLWELTPWTWLLDWASNLGSLASNLSLLDWSNVLLDYAYLTFFVKTESSISWQGSKSNDSGRFNLSHSFIAQGYTSEEKVREQASPYGFSVGWDGLSPFQLSILAALGMSRGR